MYVKTVRLCNTTNWLASGGANTKQGAAHGHTTALHQTREPRYHCVPKFYSSWKLCFTIMRVSKVVSKVFFLKSSWFLPRAENMRSNPPVLAGQTKMGRRLGTARRVSPKAPGWAMASHGPSRPWMGARREFLIIYNSGFPPDGCQRAEIKAGEH